MKLINPYKCDQYQTDSIRENRGQATSVENGLEIWVCFCYCFVLIIFDLSCFIWSLRYKYRITKTMHLIHFKRKENHLIHDQFHVLIVVNRRHEKP